MKAQYNKLSPKRLRKIDKLRISATQKRRVVKIMAEAIGYIPNEHFTQSSYMNPIMAQDISVGPGRSLTTEEEHILFYQINYARYKLCVVRRRLLRQGQWKTKDVHELLSWYNEQLTSRSKIVSCNMGLVLAMAQRAKYQGVEFTDLVSEGSMALLRSAEKFDCSRGFKFSTYACRAIFKGFSRVAKQTYRYYNHFPNQLETSMEKDDRATRQEQEERQYLADEFRVIIQNNLADLTDIERSVVQMRFSLGEETPDPQTLKQVGFQLGLTKERIRQIQNKALAKLKVVVRDRELIQ